MSNEEIEKPEDTQEAVNDAEEPQAQAEPEQDT